MVVVVVVLVVVVVVVVVVLIHAQIVKYWCCDGWQWRPYPKPIFPPKSHANVLGLTHVLRAG